jgi:enoyl-CoA hydratase/carnithine racemase
MTASYETLLVDVADGVATITFNRPEKMNAFNWKMNGEFHEAMWKCEADEEVRVIVVTGAGRAFCAGMDLSEGTEDVFGETGHKTHDDTFKTDSDHIAERSAFWRMRTPVIGAINGAAVGVGITITTMFDVRFVAEDAKLGFNFVRRGVVPDASVTWTLPRIVGATRALDLLMTGRMFSGRDAVDYGLALAAYPADQVLAAAQEYARDLAANTAPGAVAATKALIGRFLESDDRNAAMALETKLVWWSGAQPDAVEGVMSFMEKRAPSWKGSKHADFPEPVWPES